MMDYINHLAIVLLSAAACTLRVKIFLNSLLHYTYMGYIMSVARRII